MHMLVNHSSDTSRFIEDLFKKCATADQEFDLGASKYIDAAKAGRKDESEACLTIPFYKNNEKHSTPLELAIPRNDEKPDTTKAAKILNGMQNYPLGHVDCSIIDELSRCLSETHFVPEAIDYIDARLIPSGHLQSDPLMTRQALDPTKQKTVSIDGYMTMLVPYEMWMDKRQV